MSILYLFESSVEAFVLVPGQVFPILLMLWPRVVLEEFAQADPKPCGVLIAPVDWPAFLIVWMIIDVFAEANVFDEIYQTVKVNPLTPRIAESAACIMGL